MRLTTGSLLKKLLAASSLVGCLAVVQPALAQSDHTAAALEKFDEGRKAFEAKDFTTALTAFQASNSLLASPNSLLYIARCYVALGKTASAYTTFRIVERQAQDRLTSNGDKRYGATRDAALAESAEIESKVPKLIIAVPGGVPAGFVVKQNDQVVQSSSWGANVETDPGHITIDSTGPRIRPFHTEFDLQPGESHRVDVLADRIPTATIVLHFKSRPAGLAVQVDGSPVDERAASAPFELDTGVRKIDVSAPGYKPFHWAKSLNAGQTETVDVTLAAESRTVQRTGGTPKWMFFAAGGAAIATAGVGTFFALRASGQSSSEQAKNPYARDPSVKSSIQTESTAANILFVSGAVLGAGACVLAFTTQWKSPQGTTIASLTVSPLGAAPGLLAQGNF